MKEEVIGISRAVSESNGGDGLSIEGKEKSNDQG